MDKIYLRQVEFLPLGCNYFCRIVSSRGEEHKLVLSMYQADEIVKKGVIEACIFGSGQIEWLISFSSKASRRFREVYRCVQRQLAKGNGNCGTSFSCSVSDLDATVEVKLV